MLKYHTESLYSQTKKTSLMLMGGEGIIILQTTEKLSVSKGGLAFFSV